MKWQTIAFCVLALSVGCAKDGGSSSSTSSSSTSTSTESANVESAPAEALGVAPDTTTMPTTTKAEAGPAVGNQVIKKDEPKLDYGAEAYRIVSEKDEIVSVLKNGMTVITKRVPSPVVAVRGYVKTGGIYEGKWLGGGLSHLLEHLVAGGSSQRRDEAANRSLLQEIGNNSNAYTTADHTAYFINTTADHIDQAVDLLTGWLLGAKITEDEYHREYQVVQRELEKGKGEPGRQLAYMSAMNRYKVSPARVPVIGYQEVIQGLSRDDVYSYYLQTYQPNNMVLSVAGNLDPEVMLKSVQKYVADAKPGRVFSHDIPDEPPVQSPRTMVATFPKLGEAKLELAFPSIELSHPDLYALDLLSVVLSGGESSILTQEIRDKKQLVSAIGAGSGTPEYVAGSFEISMSLEPDKIADATKAVFEEIEKIQKEGIDPARLERAKTQMRTSRVSNLQTSEDIAASLAMDYISTGDPHFSDRYTEKMQDVTADQIKDVARKYLDRSRLLTTVMLPAEAVGAEGLPKAEELIRPIAVATTQESTTKASDQVTRVELENGTILLLKRVTTTPIVAVNMYAAGGLTAEDAKTNGLGNLTMEMAMRGTTTRDAKQIAEFFDSIGGGMNTGMGNHSWFWTANFLSSDFDKAMAVYADVVNNPSFPDSEVGPIKQRIMAGIQSQDADWSAQAMRYFRQQYFGPTGSPYQFQTIGTLVNVPAFTTAQMKDWYDTKVRGTRRVIAIYGDIDVDHAKQVAADLLGKGAKIAAATQPATTMPAVAAAVAPDAPTIDVQRVEVQKTEQPLAGVIIGFQSNSVIGEEATFPIAIADTMTSGYTFPTGYLHETLRGKGLVYVVHAQSFPGRNKDLPGTFFVYAGCDPRNTTEVVRLILECIARVQGPDSAMDPDWFVRSKKLVATADAMDNETAAEQASTAALDELWGLGYDYHDHFADKINAVTLESVRKIARERLWRCVVTISTPLPDNVDVKTGVRQYDSFPPLELTPSGVQHDAGSGGN